MAKRGGAGRQPADSSREARLQVRVVPRSNRDAISIDDDGQLRVRVHAAPADGAANEAVIRLLAEALSVPKTSLRIASGAASRTKKIACSGLCDDEALRRVRAFVERDDRREDRSH